MTSPLYLVMPPSTPGTISFLMRMLAKVPRIITSWLPRRLPYELKSLRATWWLSRYSPAGLSALIEPAGLMWSVVTESPRIASGLASTMSTIGTGSIVMPSK